MSTDALIDRLRNLPPDMGFDMHHTASAAHASKHPCGSACCLGGHAALMLGRQHYFPTDALAEVTGMPFRSASALCWPEDDHWAWDATSEDAIATLEQYRDTGIAEWIKAS